MQLPVEFYVVISTAPHMQVTRPVQSLAGDQGCRAFRISLVCVCVYGIGSLLGYYYKLTQTIKHFSHYPHQTYTAAVPLDRNAVSCRTGRMQLVKILSNTKPGRKWQVCMHVQAY